MFEQKTARNKIFLLKKLVNMKLKEGTLMTDHLNDFQSIVNQLAAMKNGYAWWDASIFVVVFITRQLGNFCCDY